MVAKITHKHIFFIQSPYSVLGDDMKILQQISIFLFLILFFSNAAMISNLSSEILTFWFEQLVPSLFISIVLIQILSNTSFFTDIACHLKGLCPILNLNEEGLGLVITCLLSGSPASVIIIQDAYQKQRITEKMALRLFYCTPIATLSFLIMQCGNLLHNIKAGFLLWVIQMVSTLVLLYLSRKTPIIANPVIDKTEKKHSVTSALVKSGLIVFLIGGYLLMFQTFSALINLLLPSSYQNFIKIISEFSYGCFLIAEQFPFPIAFLLISALCGFNGLCVQYQALSICELKVSVLRYIIGRLIQSLIATLISITVLPLLL